MSNRNIAVRKIHMKKPKAIWWKFMPKKFEKLNLITFYYQERCSK